MRGLSNNTEGRIGKTKGGSPELLEPAGLLLRWLYCIRLLPYALPVSNVNNGKLAASLNQKGCPSRHDCHNQSRANDVLKHGALHQVSPIASPLPAYAHSIGKSLHIQ